MTVATETLTQRTLTRDMPNGSRVVAHLEVRRALPGQRFSPSGLSPAFSLTGELYERHGTWSGATRQRNDRDPDSGGAMHDEIVRAFPRLAQFAAMHLSDPETGEPMHAEANSWYWYAGSRNDLRDAVVSSGGYTGNSDIYAHQLSARGLPDSDEGRRRYCYAVACKILRVDSIPDMPALEEVDDPDARREVEILRAQSRELATAVDVRDFRAVSEAKRFARVIDRDADKIERALIVQTYASAQAAFSAFVDAQRPRWAREAAEARAFVESLPVDEN